MASGDVGLESVLEVQFGRLELGCLPRKREG